MKHPSSKQVLIAICLVILVIIVFRFYHMFVTGFMLPDETYYYETIVLDRQVFPHREVFSAIFLLFFVAARSLPSLALAGTLYASLWGVGSAFLSYKIAQRLGISDEQTSLLLVSLLFFPVYLIMLPMFVTETMGLFFALAGIFFALRFHQGGGWADALLSSLAFVSAYKVRQAYLLFGLANLIVVLVSSKRSVRSALAYLFPLALVFPLPINLHPVQFAQPVLDFVLSSLLRVPTSLPSTPVAPADLSSFLSAFVINSPVPPADFPSFLHAFVIGLLFGYNPAFAVFALVSMILTISAAWRRLTVATGFLPWNTITGLAAYAGSLFLLITPAAGLIPIWTSTAIRASHVSLPVAFTLTYFYRRIGTRMVLATMLVLMIVASTQLPNITQVVQSNLTRTGVAIDRFSLGYRAPYYRLCDLVKNSGRTAVFALNLRGARTCLSMLTDARIWPVPASESQFRALLAEGWDTIYLYDDYYTVADPSSLKLYPEYYATILISQSYSGYVVQMIWVDAESHAFEMTPVAPAKP